MHLSLSKVELAHEKRLTDQLPWAKATSVGQNISVINLYTTVQISVSDGRSLHHPQ